MNLNNITHGLIWQDRKYIKIGILYLFMVAGGALHLTNIFDTILGVMATYIMMAISGWLVFECIHHWRSTVENEQDHRKLYVNFAVWLFIVFAGSIILENIGVHTGLVFGIYQYGDVLKPFIGSVPVAIGFAWINTTLPALVLSRQLIHREHKFSPYLLAMATGIFMVIFDIIMEPSAIKLNYWTWPNDNVPIQNYVAWFVFGALFAFIGIKLNLLKHGIPKILYHAYISQLIYFGLIIFK